MRAANLGAALIFLALAGQSAVLGWADLDALAARRFAEHALRAGGAAAGGAGYGPDELFRKARSRAALRADFALEQGLWRARSAVADTARAEGLFAAAERDFRAAVRLRPAWALAWAHLALARFNGEGPGAGVTHAMARALSLGPWEPEVQGPMAWLAMQIWEHLPGELQRAAWDGIQRAAAIDGVRDELLAWAVDFGWAGHLRPILDGDQRRRLERLREARAARP